MTEFELIIRQHDQVMTFNLGPRLEVDMCQSRDEVSEKL